MYDSYMGAEVRVTTNVGKVLRALLAKVDGDHYGYALMRATGLPSGNLYPILARLEKAGWIVGHQEDIDPEAAGRRPRRYYRLTPDGAVAARNALAQLRAAFGDGSPAPFGRPEVNPA